MAYAEARLGPHRLSTSAYRMSSLISPHPPAPILGSDFPVEPASPFAGLYAATTRLSPQTRTSPSGPRGWHPDQKLTMTQALLAFTRNPAYAWFKEDKAGAIQVGAWADFVVVDRDVAGDEHGDEVLDTVVRGTWVAGKRVYGEEAVMSGWRSKVAEWKATVAEFESAYSAMKADL